MVTVLHLCSTGHMLKSWPPRCRVQPWAGCLHTCICHQALQLAVMLGGQGGNCGPGGNYWQPPARSVVSVTCKLTDWK